MTEPAALPPPVIELVGLRGVSFRFGADVVLEQIDLALASASLNAMVERAFYSHEERLQKVSDHSMLVVDCVWPLNNRLPPSAADSDEELSQPKVGESQ